MIKIARCGAHRRILATTDINDAALSLHRRNPEPARRYGRASATVRRRMSSTTDNRVRPVPSGVDHTPQ
jgi:plasmid stabilization system protein ParE